MSVTGGMIMAAGHMAVSDFLVKEGPDGPSLESVPRSTVPTADVTSSLRSVPPERIAGMATAAFIEHFAEMIRNAIPLLHQHDSDTSRIIEANHLQMLAHIRCIEHLHQESLSRVGAPAAPGERNDLQCRCVSAFGPNPECGVCGGSGCYAAVVPGAVPADAVPA